ncbi:unnamed protein product [Nyctereutes procyonoides]|uniref:(raccoon dog) hypothetical protein n=1 Tax=Nyctereutes procyonoides TaxID=34880 RepID=A0A811ZH42_NYCPR|nr:unnamed protein product [Nyctereutes procyonoides]
MAGISNWVKMADLPPKECRLIHYCMVAWPRYRLDDQSQRPPKGTFDYQIPMDLDNPCRCQGKWSEVPYVQAFWTLRSRPSLCSRCSMSQVLLARSPPTLLFTSPKDTDPSALSPLSEPPKNLSSPPVRAPLLPPLPYHASVPRPPVPLIIPQENPDPTPIAFTPTAPEIPQLKAAAEPTPQGDPLPIPSYLPLHLVL